MSPIATHILFGLTVCALTAAMAYALGGTIWLLIALVLCLGIWLLQHLIGFARLSGSLKRPETAPAQHGGIWSYTLNQLYQQHQSQLKHRDLLRDTLRRFQAAAEVLPVGIIMLGRNGQTEWFNHSALALLQLEPQQILSGSLKKQIGQEQWQTFFANSLNGQMQQTQIELPRQNGLPRSLSLQRLPFMGEAELVLVEDISRRQQLEATRTAFVANVSHELRTPLTVINGFLEMLADYPDLPQEQRLSFVALMQQESTRMLTLINDLLTLSTLEDHGAAAETEPIDLSSLAVQIAQAGQTLSGSRHTIATNIAADVWINGSNRDLYHALSNLMFNAVRYTQDGGEIVLTLTLQDNPNPYKPPLARFAVCDNGPGIAAEHLPHLTDRFYRVDKGRSRESGGTGLGLAIAKHALAHHDSVLEIRSEVGSGSEFAAVFQTVAHQAA